MPQTDAITPAAVLSILRQRVGRKRAITGKRIAYMLGAHDDRMVRLAIAEL